MSLFGALWWGRSGRSSGPFCLQTRISITDSTALFPGTRNLRISGHCSGSCIHTHKSRRIFCCGCWDKQTVSAGAPGHWSRQPLWSGSVRHRDQPCQQARCALCVPACRVLAGDLVPLDRHLTERKGQGLHQTLGSPYNRLCNPCTSPAKGVLPN